MWKNLSTQPLDKLLLKDLQDELRVRDRYTKGKKKPALEKEFEELRMGINNFPALLQDDPKASLTSLHLQNYEISPTEPLHDLKGHLGNIIEESLTVAAGQVHSAIADIKRSHLSRDTIRCSDLRKATILIYLKLREVDPNGQLTDLYRTAVEISCICYAHNSKNTKVHSCPTQPHISSCPPVFHSICQPKDNYKTKDVWKVLPFLSESCCTHV